MAGNIQADSNGNIYVEFDYNNIILVDPNRTINNEGQINERLVDHENLVMYANLEADVLPRTKLLLGVSPENSQRQTLSVAKINFLRPTKNSYLSSGYYDELTGRDSLTGQAGNQKLERNVLDSQNQGFFESTVVDQENVSDNGLLGITSINIKVSSSFIPTVSMELEDVQGRALFQLGNNSPYASFFNLPYPQFYLTLKGYYGQAIRYQLNLLKFNARFNSQNGNYQVTLDFQGFKFNVLNEITISHLLAAPHMYSKRFNVNSGVATPNTSAGQPQSSPTSGTNNKSNSTENNNLVSTSFVSEKGYQKIVEVYSEYKSKGLIPPDFPELTLMQLINKFDTFQQRIVDSYPKVNVEPLTNIRNYTKSLQGYFNDIVGTSGSWYSRFIDPKAIFMNNGDKIYYFKQNILGDPIAESGALTQLSTIITSYNKTLEENPSLGKDNIRLNNLSLEKILITSINKGDIDYFKTAQVYFNVPSPSSGQTSEIRKTIDAILLPRQITQQNAQPKQEPPPLFQFDGQGRFVQTINQIKTEADRKLQEVEAAITEDLKNRIQSQSLGIGFNPTARNIIAVIMANTEGFLRLLDGVHTSAWNVKYDPVRKATIQDTNRTSAPNTEVRRQANITSSAANQNQGIVTAQEPVYPWPQFFIESPDDKKGRFQITYIGDPSVVDLTQGYIFEKWPEVEFVEEYMKGLNQKFTVPISQVPIESQNTTFLISFNAIEFPQKSNLPYSNKEQLKFLYEIWERQFVTARYSNFARANSNQIQNIMTLNRNSESSNIVKAIGDSAPNLIYLLKNTPFTAQNFTAYLREYSNNGTGRFWQDFIRDFFVTPYIKTETETPFSILQTTDLGLEPQSEVGLSGLTQLVSGAINDPLIIDTYPFRNYEWDALNMATSEDNRQQQVYNTKQSLKVFNDRNVISNFTNIYDYTTNRPVTNFSYLNVAFPDYVIQPIETTNENLKEYFRSRTENPNLLMPTEGSVRYLSPSKALPDVTTTSMLNTPYFVNAIQEGVENERNNVDYPYVTAAYLFLNSLPLASLREKYKTKDIETDLDYIASCFNKFGAIHKMPYPWILKLGSIWHRYKTYVETGTDILSNSWRNFDYIGNFDPDTTSVSKTYNFEITKGAPISITLQNQTQTSIQLQPGFYPKLINDFNRFLNGTDLYKNYTDGEIQKSINDGMLLYQFPNSKINTTQGGVSLNLTTWSCLLPKNIKEATTSTNDCAPQDTNSNAENYYIIPSFGCNLNQSKYECLQKDNPATTVVDLTFNPSMYNGTVRTFWASSNYGYFDSNQVTKPSPEQYINVIDPKEKKQNPFKIYAGADYSFIEEIFGVFDSKSLNLIEQEFLNFCKPSTNINFPISQSQIDRTNYVMNATYRNFQALMRNVLSVYPNQSGMEIGDFFQNVIAQQFNNLNGQIKGFMEYDWILRNGNPSKYSRRIWDSFISYNSTSQTVVSPINFESYVPNSLPTNGGNTTLSLSKQQYPKEWQALYKEVGFSTISGLTYSDSGSYITDFFVDNNIKFSVENITLCSQLAKIYATQKSLNPKITSNQFKTSLNFYLGTLSTFQTDMLGLLIQDLKAKLPNYEQPQEATINSQVQSMQGKVETYEVFKALNDKWVAGSDYSTKTLFEDILFLDRASRNIGDTIILDVFDIKSMLSKNYLNEGMSVYTLISGMLMKNNFTVMPLPAYVNFYNVQEVDGVQVPNPESSLAFADNLWGTFTNVDYRKSGPKMVCFYVGKPSSHLELSNVVSGYGNDAFEFRRSSEVPLLENQQGKTDWGLSNKCVGFNVDIGIRNQNVFTSFSVGQDNGVATSESIQSILEMINQTNTRTVGNQDASLYNYYKNRSYTCEVVCLGNALIQPTMYFNLRHVPMFNGPYMITNVSHSIQAGTFQTQFSGVRQGIYDLPPIDNFIQSINQNLLTQIEALVVQKTDENTTSGTTTQSAANNVITGGSNQSDAAENSCSANLQSSYLNYVVGTRTPTTISSEEFANKLLAKLPNNLPLATAIYMITYIRSFSKSGDPNGQFTSTANNFGLISLDVSNGAKDQYFDSQKYFCYNADTLGGKKSLPMAFFKDVDSYIDYMISAISPNIANISEIGMVQYYVTQFPSQIMSAADYNKDKSRYENEFAPKFRQAALSAKNVKLTSAVKVETTPTPTGSINNTPAPTPTCPPTQITSFKPSQGIPGTIITLSGSNLQYITSIEVKDFLFNSTVQVDPRTIQLIGNNKLKFSLPIIPNLTIQSFVQFLITSTNNSTQIIVGQSPNLFTYKP